MGGPSGAAQAAAAIQAKRRSLEDPGFGSEPRRPESNPESPASEV
jgi:hypothetical protein